MTNDTRQMRAFSTNVAMDAERSVEQGIECLKCCLSSGRAWLRIEHYVGSGKAAVESLYDQRPYFIPVQPGPTS
jgi:hypothetical protein